MPNSSLRLKQDTLVPVFTLVYMAVLDLKGQSTAWCVMQSLINFWVVAQNVHVCWFLLQADVFLL